MSVIDEIIKKAQQLRKTVVFPESTEPRTLEAVAYILKHGIAKVKMVGSREEASAAFPADQLTGTEFIGPETFEGFEAYVDELVRLRRHKGVDAALAETLLKNPLYFGAMMLRMGDADGMVAGAISKTDDVLRAALQVVKTAEGIKNVNGCYIMSLPKPTYGENGVLVFADCAIIPDPTPEQLADIAQSSAATVRNILGFEPRVAMLSFSTKGSGKHAMVDKVSEAVGIVRERDPGLLVDGEMQADAALVASVAKLKCPDSRVAGKANVLVFPDLNAANIGYKLVQRLAEAEVIGLVTQGLSKPVNDLSRGAGVKDIINIAAITALQAEQS